MSGNSIKETQDILIRYMIALGIDLSEKEEEMIYNCRDMEKLKKALWIATVFFEKMEKEEIKKEIINFIKKEK